MSIYIRYPAAGGAGAIGSINGDTTFAQLIVGGGGISVATVTGTTTISSIARQVVIGTAATVIGTLTGTSYVPFSNSAAVTLVASRSGPYKVWGTLTTSIDGTIGNLGKIRIGVASGSANTPTTVFNQSCGIYSTTASQNETQVVEPWAIFTLVAGLSYTFEAQGLAASAGTVRLLSSTPFISTGHVIVAEQYF